MNNVFQGNNYRITILSDILIRLEYSETGNFVDDYTEFVRNRTFTPVSFNKKEDENYFFRY